MAITLKQNCNFRYKLIYIRCDCHSTRNNDWNSHGALIYVGVHMREQRFWNITLQQILVMMPKSTPQRKILWDFATNRGVRVPLFCWFPLFWKSYCAKISAFSFIFSLFLAFSPNFTLFFLVFCLWPLTPLHKFDP